MYVTLGSDFSKTIHFFISSKNKSKTKTTRRMWWGNEMIDIDDDEITESTLRPKSKMKNF